MAGSRRSRLSNACTVRRVTECRTGAGQVGPQDNGVRYGAAVWQSQLVQLLRRITGEIKAETLAGGLSLPGAAAGRSCADAQTAASYRTVLSWRTKLLTRTCQALAGTTNDCTRRVDSVEIGWGSVP